jgi:hypothetical protein
MIRVWCAIVAICTGIGMNPLPAVADPTVTSNVLDKAAAEKILQSSLAAQQASQQALQEARNLFNEAHAQRLAAEASAANAVTLELKLEKSGGGHVEKHPRLKLFAFAALSGMATAGTVLGIVALSQNHNYVSNQTFLQEIRNLQLNQRPGPQGPVGPPGPRGFGFIPP